MERSLFVTCVVYIYNGVNAPGDLRFYGSATRRFQLLCKCASFGRFQESDRSFIGGFFVLFFSFKIR